MHLDLHLWVYGLLFFLIEFIQDQRFVYQKYSFAVNDVYVSAIRSVQQLSYLFVGFNIGCFIVYNLCESAIAYTSPCSPQQKSPIIDFVYIEPENDPKCFVYVWVARGNEMKPRHARYVRMNPGGMVSLSNFCCTVTIYTGSVHVEVVKEWPTQWREVYTYRVLAGT